MAITLTESGELVVPLSQETAQRLLQATVEEQERIARAAAKAVDRAIFEKSTLLDVFDAARAEMQRNGMTDEIAEEMMEEVRRLS